MKTFRVFLFSGGLLAGVCTAQVVPAHPKKFATRPIGGTTTGGAFVLPRNEEAPQKVRSITYIVLSVDRLWTSTEGKIIQGKLIAFEDMVAEANKGAPPPPDPVPPESPTVVRDGNIRLLMKGKPVVVPLTRFRPDDVEFVEQVRKAYTRKPVPEP